MSEKIEAIDEFTYYSYDRKFVHYLFARILFYLERSCFNKEIEFADLMVTRKKNRFVLTSLLGYEYDDYADLYDEEEFNTLSEALGNQVLIPNQLSQELYDLTDSKKLDKLKKSYISALCNDSINNNGNFDLSKWGFESMESFNANAIKVRTNALSSVIKEIWALDTI